MSEEHDEVVMMEETIIGKDGMKIDRELYAQNFEKEIQAKVQVDEHLQGLRDAFDELGLEKYAREEILNKSNEFFTVEKLNQAYGFADRVLGLGEMMMKAL